MKKILILVMALFFALVGCTSVSSIDCNCKNINSINYIYGKEYKLDYSNITITFEKDKVYGLSGINRYFTSYEIKEDGTISFKPIATTLMAGDPELMDRERKYLNFLKDAYKINIINEEKIQIISKNEVLNFTLKK